MAKESFKNLLKLLNILLLLLKKASLRTTALSTKWTRSTSQIFIFSDIYSEYTVWESTTFRKGKQNPAAFRWFSFHFSLSPQTKFFFCSGERE